MHALPFPPLHRTALPCTNHTAGLNGAHLCRLRWLPRLPKPPIDKIGVLALNQAFSPNYTLAYLADNSGINLPKVPNIGQRAWIVSASWDTAKSSGVGI